MNTKIILLATLAIVGVLGTSQLAYAADPTLSISPATVTSTVDASFNVSVQLDPANNQVCVIKGTLNFSNLTCQNITVASGLMTAEAPTCASPSFTLGIPKCTTAPQNIFTVSVAGNQAGRGLLSFSGLKIIGAGSNVSSVWYGGAYNIIAVAQTTEPNEIVTPAPEPITIQNVEQPVITEEAQTSAEQVATGNDIPTGIGAAGLLSVVSDYFWPLLIILIILVAGYGIYYFITKKKK